MFAPAHFRQLKFANGCGAKEIESILTKSAEAMGTAFWIGALAIGIYIYKANASNKRANLQQQQTSTAPPPSTTAPSQPQAAADRGRQRNQTPSTSKRSTSPSPARGGNSQKRASSPVPQSSSPGGSKEKQTPPKRGPAQFSLGDGVLTQFSKLNSAKLKALGVHSPAHLLFLTAAANDGDGDALGTLLSSSLKPLQCKKLMRTLESSAEKCIREYFKPAFEQASSDTLALEEFAECIDMPQAVLRALEKYGVEATDDLVDLEESDVEDIASNLKPAEAALVKHLVMQIHGSGGFANIGSAAKAKSYSYASGKLEVFY